MHTKTDMKPHETDKVILVDENDKETGAMEKMEAHKKALLHRAISVFILNSEGKWLLQRRALGKYHSSGLWTNTCCSHPFPGETSENAAHRRLQQEMGMQAGLKEIFHFVYKEQLDNDLTEYELDHVFVGSSDIHPETDPAEVEEWKYISFDDLKKDMDKNPEKYTVWFRKIAERVHWHISGKEL